MVSQNRNGILSGGNWIVDYIKIIDTYPQENALANIREEKMDTGGAPFNVLKALRKIGVSFPLEGIGLVGDDAAGQEVLRQCRQFGIENRQIRTVSGCGTSYTDVMTVAATGKRTFFHYRGASSALSEGDFDFSTTHARFFHLGYLLLLDELDRIDTAGRTGASRVLEHALRAGMITSVDLVSEQSERYMPVVSSSLPYIDILFLNEYETQGLTDISILNTLGYPDLPRAEEAARKILSNGVRNWVIMHFPKGAIAFNRQGEICFQPAVSLPGGVIKGTVGAGDAFAAGVLGALHENWPMQEALKSGVCVAATSLLAPGASEGIKTWQQCLDWAEQWAWA